MARKKKRPSRRRKGPRPQPYDAQMIRDFLEHLMWEVRISHFETVSSPGTINPELVQQLTKYMAKRRAALLPIIVSRKAVLSTDTFMAEFNEMMRTKREKEMEHLEALQDLFDQALGCIEAANAA